MSYHLGVDLGTTYTAAAIWRDSRVEIANLGNRSPVIPSVILLREDEEILTGESAARRAATEPGRVAREFKRRLGDPTPIIVGGTPYSAASLMGRLLRWVVDKITESEGGPPTSIAVSHPANWGQYKTELLDQAVQVADLDGVTILTEPEAAAIHYASQARVDPGSVIAVYDLGGGTFDAAVLRKTDDGFEILGEPQGVERLGGLDFDEAVFQHVVRATDGAIDQLDIDDPASMAAVARLRDDCVEAKEALSADTDVSIPVMLPNLQTEVRLTRAEFEHLVRPALTDSITSLKRALRSASVEPAEVSAVLLVGGSSRIPLVAQLVGSEFGRPVAVDAHPKHGIALGAAIVAAHEGGALATLDPDATLAATPPLDPTPPPAPAPAASVVPVVAAAAATAAVVGATSDTPDAPAASQAPPPTAEPPPAPAAATATPPAPPPTQAADAPTQAVAPPPVAPPPGPADGSDDGGRKPPLAAIIGGVAAVVILIVGAFVLLGGDDDAPAEVSQQGSTTLATTDDSTGSTEATAAPTSDTTAPPAPTGPFVTLADASVEGSQFRLGYSVANFTPDINGGPDSLHLHFFLNTTEPANAGNNGNPPGVWEITDDPTSFLMTVGPADVGAATQICGVVATVDHNVFDPDSGTCVDLPT